MNRRPTGAFAAGETFAPEMEIATVQAGRPHVVILGAGASRAAFPKGDAAGHLLPVMKDFTDIVGLRPILARHGVTDPPDNFEELYTKLTSSAQHASCAQDLAQKVQEYFSRLRIPDHPTIYDHLVLSLRPRDVIATFNWDPFLVLAAQRNAKVVDLPRLLFLHGNVAVGYCEKDKQMGYSKAGCRVCGERYTPTPLLYPIAKKNYTKEPFIKAQWQDLRDALKKACRLTVFGYGAPSTDVEAMALMKRAWGRWETRNMEQIELIDIQPRDKLHKAWSAFIHTHHYGAMKDFYSSSIARHPRRTGEAYAATHLYAMWEDGHPLPKDAAFPELWSWFAPLTEAEKAARQTTRPLAAKRPMT